MYYIDQCFFTFCPSANHFLFRLITLGLSTYIVHCDKYFASASSSMSLRSQYTQTFEYLSMRNTEIQIFSNKTLSVSLDILQVAPTNILQSIKVMLQCR